MKGLREGDGIELETGEGIRRRYRVQDRRIADSRSDFIPREQDRARLVLVTCYPFDAVQPGGPLRYVVTARADVAPS